MPIRFYDHIIVLVWKKRLQKTLIFEKWQHFKNGQKWPQCEGYSPCKIPTLAQKLNDSTTTLELLCAKSPSKKHIVLEKWEHFENGENRPQYKRYSPCKILTLAQKLKMQKRCEKRFYDHVRNIVCKKGIEKTANIGKMRAFWKWPKMGTIQRL